MTATQNRARPAASSPGEPRTLSERSALGRGVRAGVPRSVHGEWTPATDRPDPVSLLEEQAASRVPELVPLRYARMLVSPFTFFRGAAYLMASDLAAAPRTGLTVQLCGDAHLSNFGSYLAPDRRLVFGLNDFDESLPGPFEWDLKRLAASFAVAGRDRGFDDAERDWIVRAVGESYRTSMTELAGMGRLDIWYQRLDVDQLETVVADSLEPDEVKRFRKNVARAKSKNSRKAFGKLVRTVDGRPSLVGDPPLVVPVSDLVPDLELHQIEEALRALLGSYRRSLRGDHRHLIEGFRFASAARKVVGVGSVGTRAWIVLMLGTEDGDPLLLQAKEAQTSVLEPFLGKSRFRNHGQRVVEGQRLMQSASDVLLGWIRTSGVDGVSRDFYVRQLWDGKGSADIDSMRPSVMGSYARLCGWTLARAHARSGDPVAIAGYLGRGDRFDRALARFAETYADQNERNHAALAAAVGSGRVEAAADALR
ncbi:DUF2252 domain-containing protein [Nocardioides sp. GXQ0305]|uniref:DUF2252 domain-containing protein n=1 Tax=Nocardioides sp. GXQ0305 TaxID=3423912 RepID=UPI003D7DAC46